MRTVSASLCALVLAGQGLAGALPSRSFTADSETLSSSAPDRIVIPALDGTYDRHDLTNLVPTQHVNLHYTERGAGSLAVQVSLNLTVPALVLENSAHIDSVECSPMHDLVTLILNNDHAHQILKSSQDIENLVIITNSPTCNSEEERGVYLVKSVDFTAAASDRTVHTYDVQQKSLKDFAPTMRLQFDAASSNGLHHDLKRRTTTPQTTAAQCTPRQAAFAAQNNCNVRGYVAEPHSDTPQPTVNTFNGCVQACESSKTCKAFGWQAQSKKCWISTYTLAQQQVFANSKSPLVLYNRNCYSCPTVSSSTSAKSTTSPSVTPTSTSVSAPVIYNNGQYTITGTPPDTPELRSAYSSILSSRLTFNAGGTVLATIQPTSGIVIPTPTFSPSNTAVQSSNSAALVADGLAQPTDVLNSVAAALASFQPPDDPSATSASFSSDSSPTAASNTVSAATSTPSSGGVSTSLHQKRGILDDLQEWACNDFTEALSEDWEAACGALEAGEAVYCLASGKCFAEQKSSPPEEWTFDAAWKITWSEQNAYLGGNGIASLYCIDCEIGVSNIEFKGDIVVDTSSNQVLGGTMQIFESSKKSAVFGLTTTDASTGSLQFNVNTAPLSGVTAGGIFSISPSIVYGFNVQWSTATAVDNVQGGGSVSVDGASAKVDLVSKAVTNPSGFQPSISVTYPVIDPASSLVSMVQSSIQLQVSILGNNLNEVAAFTTQTSFGFTSAFTSKCGSGNNGLISGLISTAATANIGGQGTNLFDPISNSLYTQCANIPTHQATPAQISSLASIGAGFCSSYINYTPVPVTVSLLSTYNTVMTTTSTTGTYTYTPDPSTLTVTITNAGGAKRDLATPTTFPGVVATTTANSASTSYVNRARAFAVPAITAAPAYKLEPRQYNYVPAPSMVKGWPPYEISSACSQVATGSTTLTQYTATTTSFTSTQVNGVLATASAATPTVTVTRAITPHAINPARCNNEGVQWSFYSMNLDQNNLQGTIAQLANQSPGATGTTNAIGGMIVQGNNNGYAVIYGTTTNVGAEFSVLNHQGYLYAPITGTYTFTATNINDWIAIWVGPYAYSGWTGYNANLVSPLSAAASFTISLSAGQYYAYRAILVNTWGAGGFGLTITDPNGDFLTDSNDAGYNGVVRYSCHGNASPVYPAWPISCTYGSSIWPGCCAPGTSYWPQCYFDDD